jgi:sugar phosphate isomerase/epimerase
MTRTNPLNNALVFNATAAKYSTLAIEIDIALRVGFAGIETTAKKIRDYLDVGHTVADLRAALKGLPIYGIGTILDVERHGSDARSLIADAEEMFGLAGEIGARAIQVITGPLDFREVMLFGEGRPKKRYRGVLEYGEVEQIEVTAANLRLLAEMGERVGVIVYLEALAWAPLKTVNQQLTLLQRTDHNNLKMVVDYWHLFACGEKPEDIAKIDKDYIYGVHVCDSLPIPPNDVPDESVLRDVETGKGIIDLKAWTDAVKATGYSNWWCSETFCRKIQQENTYEIAAQMKSQLQELLIE